MAGSVIDFSALVPTDPPPIGLRGFRPQLVAGVRRAHDVLVAHGSVGDGQVYAERHLARWRAERLSDLVVQLGLRERWELRRRVWAVDAGFQWSVQLDDGGQAHDRAHDDAC